MSDELLPQPETQPPAAGHAHEFHLNLLGAIQGLLTIVVVAAFVLTFLVQPFRIPSESMEPTLLIGDFVLVDKVALAPAGAWHWLLPYRQVQRGEVIVFRRSSAIEGDESSGRLDEYLVKRVAAVPGDRVRMDGGRMTLHGARQSEPYAIFLPSGPDAYRDDFPASLYTDAGVDSAWWVQMHRLVQNGALVVPQHEYFALGDNRNHSLDSRYWGFVDRQQIVGPAWLIYFSVRSASPDDVELAQSRTAQNDRMSRRANSGSNGFARWERMFQVVR